MSTLLTLSDVTKRFGNLTAIDDLSLDVRPEGLTALIGPNGAGKTTMYNLITGKLSPSSGSIRFQDELITETSPAERTRLGIGRSFQITNIFEGLTVRQNLRAPVLARSNYRWNPSVRVEDAGDVDEEIDRVLDLMGLTDLAGESCSTLSYGDKRRVEIGITLATDPSLVLLDEPTAGMNPEETTRMTQLIQDLKQETDTTFFVTEHDVDVIFSIATRIVVLQRGQIIADGTPEDIRTDERVQQAYLGGS